MGGFVGGVGGGEDVYMDMMRGGDTLLTRQHMVHVYRCVYMHVGMHA